MISALLKKGAAAACTSLLLFAATTLHARAVQSIESVLPTKVRQEIAPKATSLDASLDQLHRFKMGEANPAATKLLSDIDSTVTKIQRTGGNRADLERAFFLIDDALDMYAVDYKVQKGGHHSSSSSSSSSSHCNVCKTLKRLRDQLEDCCKGLHKEIEEIKSLLREKCACSQPKLIDHVPVTLHKEGKYCVTKDLVYSDTKEAIVIASNLVTINFNNHGLLLTDPAATGIFAEGVSEITIENDKIQSLVQSTNPTSAAIHFIQVDTAKIDNVFTQNSFFGIQLEECVDIAIVNSHCKDHTAITDLHGNSPAAILVDSSSAVQIDNCVTEGTVGTEEGAASFHIHFLGTSANCSVTNTKLLYPDTGIHGDGITGLLVENCLLISSPTSFFNAVQLGGTPPLTTTANDIIIRNCTFINQNAVATFDGLFAFSGTGLLVENCIFDMNTVAADSYFPAPIHFGCGSINGGCDPTLSFSNAIIRNTILQNASDLQVYVELGSNIVIDNCEISQANVANVQFDQATDCTVKNCTISGSLGDGILINSGSNNNALLANVVNDNNNGIVIMSGALYNHLQDNKVYANANKGIESNDNTTEVFFNTSCNNGGPNCSSVTGLFPQQSPGASPAVAGSNLCCPEP